MSASAGGCDHFSAGLGTLAAGAGATVTRVALVSPGDPAGPRVADDVLATGTTPDAANTNNTATALGAAQAQADLSVTRSAPGGVSLGDTITYAVAVTNSGPSDAQGVQVVESLPANASLLTLALARPAPRPGRGPA